MKKTHRSKLFDNMVILNELLKDCRRSMNSIAKACCKNKQQVWRRIKKLEEENVIWGYSAVIDENKIGYHRYMALIKIGPQTLEAVNKVIERHLDPNARGRENIRIIESYYLNGLFDWIVIFAAPSIVDAKKYCGFLEVVYADFVEGVELLEVIFPVARSGKINPEIEKLKEFAIPETD